MKGIALFDEFIGSNLNLILGRQLQTSSLNCYTLLGLLSFAQILQKSVAQKQMEQLDEIIGFLNKPQKLQLPPLKNSVTKPLIIQKQLPQKFRYLTFKPWSGQITVSQGVTNKTEVIKEQIEKDSSRDSNTDDVQDFADYSNAASENQVGYFYNFQATHVKLIKYLLDQNGFKFANSNKNWSVYWSSTIIKPEIYPKLLPYQKVNHFPNSFNMTRKDLMNKNISKMQAKYGGSHFSFLPKTFILPKEYDLLRDQMQKNGYTYIAKPHNSSQGKGITVTSSLEVIESKLQRYSSLVVSHYIDNPLLINRLKFDLRIYVGITGINPLRIYVYEQGLARFATEVYDHLSEDPQSRKFQHLTNYSINKKNTEFLKPSEDEEYFGSKWSLTSLRDFLAFNIGKFETDDLFQRINELIVKTLICGQSILYSSFQKSVPYINGCFQVLGFDILIDSNLKPWLIQINMSPSMNTDSPLDLKIKGNMIADLLTMTGVIPLDQRYNDGSHVKFESNHFFKSQGRPLEQNSAIDKFMIKLVEEQHQRRGKWNRVFPVRNNRYKMYFQVDRYFNRLLREGPIEPIFKGPFIFGSKQEEKKQGLVRKNNFRTKQVPSNKYTNDKSSEFRSLRKI